jgi:predicted secreted protein
MSVKNANILGVYAQTDATAAEPLKGSTSGGENTLTGIGTALAALNLGDGTYAYTMTDGTSVLVSLAGSTATEIQLDLVGCATNTTLDVSSSINEAICRDGSGGSTRHLVSGVSTWTISVDGLFGDEDDANSVSNAPSLIELANDKQFVVVKFKTSETDASAVTYIGMALIESVSLSGGVDEIATYSVSFNGHGNLYKLGTVTA